MVAQLQRNGALTSHWKRRSFLYLLSRKYSLSFYTLLDESEEAKQSKESWERNSWKSRKPLSSRSKGRIMAAHSSTSNMSNAIPRTSSTSSLSSCFISFSESLKSSNSSPSESNSFITLSPLFIHATSPYKNTFLFLFSQFHKLVFGFIS